LKIKPLHSQGKVASYIPVLASISPEKFGMATKARITIGDFPDCLNGNYKPEKSFWL
jgi:hypothetical protein